MNRSSPSPGRNPESPGSGSKTDRTAGLASSHDQPTPSNFGAAIEQVETMAWEDIAAVSPGLVVSAGGTPGGTSSGTPGGTSIGTPGSGSRESSAGLSPSVSPEGYLPLRQVDHPSRPLADADGPADYRIVGQLGRGGTAVVYQAHQRAVDREVAMKYLRRELADKPEVRRRFLQEARVIGSLEHPGIIAIHEVATDGSGQLFYSMKRIDGSPWNEQIDTLDQSRNIDILLAIADAIRYAHSQQVIHRDLKPENIMLGRFGEIFVADWGMAMRGGWLVDPSQHAADLGAADLGTADLGTAMSDAIGGTPAYMAPEMTTGQLSQITPQTDIYLLGAILYRIMTGGPPHRGETLRECIRAAADNLIVPTDVDHDLVDIARRAMNTRPSDRYHSVDEFIDHIRTQRRHQQSVSMVARIRRGLTQMDAVVAGGGSVSIEKVSFYESVLIEATELWPDNAGVDEVRHRLAVHRARCIAAAGDLKLAIETLEKIGQRDSELAMRLQRQQSARSKQQRAVSRYSALFVQSPDAGLLIAMPEGLVVETNRQFEDWFGFDRRDVIGKPIAELNLWVCPQRRAVLGQEIERNVLIEDFDAQLFQRDGTIVDVVIAGRRVELEDRQMMVATIRDVSARKRAERDLRRSRDRMKNLQRMAGLGSWSYNVVDDSIAWSDELFAMFGRDRSLGPPSRSEFYDLVHPEDRDRLRKSVDQARRFATAYEVRIRQCQPGGGYQWVTIRGEPLRDADGQVDEIYGVTIPEISR